MRPAAPLGVPNMSWRGEEEEGGVWVEASMGEASMVGGEYGGGEYGGEAKVACACIAPFNVYRCTGADGGKEWGKRP